jgi:hypothetical protein
MKLIVCYFNLASVIVGSSSMSKQLRKIRLTSTNSDLHFIYEESCSCKWVVEKEVGDEVEAREFSKHEASKPLFITH